MCFFIGCVSGTVYMSTRVIRSYLQYLGVQQYGQKFTKTLFSKFSEHEKENPYNSLTFN